jgi:hypothetical protein
MSGGRPIARLAAVAFRLIAIALLLALCVAIAAGYLIGSTREYVQLFGTNTVGESSAYYLLQDGEIILSVSTGWDGTHAKAGTMCRVPGLTMMRTIVIRTAQSRGDAVLSVRVRWWLLLIAFGLSLYTTWRLGRPLLRRHFSGPNQCPTCGYDLRATPDRCPECGTATAVG